MKTIAQIFRRHNFIIIDHIMNDGSFHIDGKMAINPLDKVFSKPIKSNSHKKRKSNETRS
jgi:hypothetical protein